MGKKSIEKDSLINTKTLRAGILGALLSFIVAKLFDPLFNGFYSLFLTLQGSFVKTISDFTYREISNGYTEKVSQSLLYLLVVITCSFLFYIHFRLKEYYGEALINIEKKVNSPLTQEADTDFDNMPVSELMNKSVELIDETAKLLKDSEYVKKQADILLQDSKRLLKRSLRLLDFFLIIAGIFIFFIYSKNIFVINKVTTMTNNIEIVSPYISDVEYRQLKSEFHTIKSRGDYEDLAKSLKHIADSHSIDLKK